MSDQETAPNFDEIRAILSALPGPDAASGAAARARQDRLTKPQGSLGRLEELATWMATWQGKAIPELRRARVAVFAGNHGVVARGVSAFPAEVTRQMVANFTAGGAAVNQICGVVDAELRVYELDLEAATQDFTTGPAMEEEECARAMAYGMMAVDGNLHLLALGEMGIGNTTSGAALCRALFGGTAADWVGRGTGIDDAGVQRKIAAIEAGIAANAGALGHPLEVLRCFGGFELAAICGAVIAARLAHTPVVLDGYTCTAAAAVLHAIDPGFLDHCVVGHCSAEPGHARLLARLGKTPLLDYGMRLGEGSGAALAIPILRAAVACLANMATFEQAGVSTGEDAATGRAP
ncbi:MAG: nicotinate-nucleotide--dimethylbenzimidazole phosphoribosyltransferase [Rhodospirillaceae bacterium]